MKCRIHTPEHIGKVYEFHTYSREMGDIVINITLEDEDGNVFSTIVAARDVEWIYC